MIGKIAVSALALAIGSTLYGQAAKPASGDDAANEVKPMTIGDPARPIDISDWIKGEKVEEFKNGKVYVLEFWATWCPPCRTSMPHITKLQEEYKDYGVTFIGVSDEDLKTVTDFLGKSDKDGKKWTDKIGYTLTTDPDKSVYRDYFTAAGQRGIPCAFIIGKDLHIEWIGHPMEIDEPLNSVVHDTWNRKAFKAKWEEAAAAERQAEKHNLEFRAAMKAKDWKKAISLLDARIAEDSQDLNACMQKFSILLIQMNEPAKAYAFGDEFAKNNWENPMLLNALAWTTVDSKDVKTRDFDFAMRLAERAVKLTDEKEAAILDTLARVHFEKGDLANAVRVQKQAVEHAEAGMGDELKATLKKYEEALANKK